MWRGTKVLVLFAALATVALVAARGAVASPPTTASGTFTYTSSTFNSIRSAGGNIIIDLSATVSYTGTFSGTSTVQGTLIIHADGSANFHDVEIFTGTVNGVPRSVAFTLAGRTGPSMDITPPDTMVSAPAGVPCPQDDAAL